MTELFFLVGPNFAATTNIRIYSEFLLFITFQCACGTYTLVY